MKKLAMITVILLVAVMAFSFSDDLYRRMTRGADDLIDTRYDFNGEVLQWMKDGDYDVYRIYTKGSNGNYYDHTILLVVAPDSSFGEYIEDDIIIIKQAVYRGNYTYESIWGSSITVPLFLADNKTVSFLK